jgi:glycosyltransferase involved in cell wall biosynthesis
MTPIKLGFVLLSPSSAPQPSTRVAVLNMFPFLRESGFEPQVVFEPPVGVEQPELPSGLAQRLSSQGFQVVVLQKVRGSSVQAFVGELSRLGIRTVFEVCDLVDSEMARLTDVTIAVTDYLKSLYPAQLQHKVHVVHDGIENPSVVKHDWGKHRGSRARPLRAVLVTSSSLTRLPILGTPPPWLEVSIVGRYPPVDQWWRRMKEIRWKYLKLPREERMEFLRFMLHPRVRCQAWDPVGVYSALRRADVGIIPVEFVDEEPSACLPVPLWSIKSENRLTMKMAVGLPVVASPIPSYMNVMRSGVDGFFAATQGEWLECLGALRDPAMRRHMGTRARESVLQRYSMEEQARLLIRILRGLIRDDTEVLRARSC